ncbi:MAG: MoxR family ATPase [Pseudomonadota bacterium]
MNEDDINSVLRQLGSLREGIAKVIVGQQQTVEELLITLLAGGHCLLQGVPGLGKTLLAKTLAQVVSLPFRRIQFTPDLMPADILGAELLRDDESGGRRFEFQPGPVFTNLLLADEINRTPPKTQAALLEAMGEQHVTVAGDTRPLPTPFFVMATQNPLEQGGTYPLPEAQLDRFLLMVLMDYPALNEEIDVLRRTTGATTDCADALMSAEQLLSAQQVVRDVPISDALMQLAANWVRATRPGDAQMPQDAVDWVRWGAGPRAGQALVSAAKARAVLHGRLAVTLEDLRQVSAPVLRHRVILNFHAEAQHVSVDQVVDSIIEAMPEPADPLSSSAH